MQKWGFFSMGAMAGVIAVLSFALLLQQQNNLAYAAAGYQGDDGANKLVVTSGMSNQNQADMLWVLHKHQPMIKPKDQDKELVKTDHLTLSLYKITKNGEGMKLIAVRDISYDEELTEFNVTREQPTVRDIYEQLKKQVEPKK